MDSPHTADSAAGMGGVLLLTALCGPAWSLQAPPYPITESYDRESPELRVYAPSDGVVVRSMRSDGGGLQFVHIDFGLEPDANVDAMSDGTDIFPPKGPGISPPPATCRFIFTEYTVDRRSVGLPGSFIRAEAMTDGAASDTFGVTYVDGGGPFFSLESDALEVTPLPNQTDLDALMWPEARRYPVYFSVDRQTAEELGVSPADILQTLGTGRAPTIFRSAAELGLREDDDVDALAIDMAGNLVFSLTRDSASLRQGRLALIGPAGVIISDGGGTNDVWDYAASLGLRPTDELNGIRITDPGYETCWASSLPDPSTGFPHVALFLQESSGGRRRLVDVPVRTLVNLRVHPLDPLATSLVLARSGRPCFAEAVPLMPPGVGLLCFDPGTGFPVASGSGQFRIFFPTPSFPIELTFQGVSQSPGNPPRTTNAVTLTTY